jgi:hypothetical protein
MRHRRWISSVTSWRPERKFSLSRSWTRSRLSPVIDPHFSYKAEEFVQNLRAGIRRHQFSGFIRPPRSSAPPSERLLHEAIDHKQRVAGCSSTIATNSCSVSKSILAVIGQILDRAFTMDHCSPPFQITQPASDSSAGIAARATALTTINPANGSCRLLLPSLCEPAHPDVACLTVVPVLFLRHSAMIRGPIE